MEERSKTVKQQTKGSERAEYERLIFQFNKAEEQENTKNLLFGSNRFFRAKAVDDQ